MELQPEMIYSAIAGLCAAIAALWRKTSNSEAECRAELRKSREDLNKVWARLYELKSSENWNGIERRKP